MYALNTKGFSRREQQALQKRRDENRDPKDDMPEHNRRVFYWMMVDAAKEKGLEEQLETALENSLRSDSNIYPILGAVNSLGLTQEFLADPSLLLSKGIDELRVYFQLKGGKGPVEVTEDNVHIWEKMFMEKEIEGEVDLDSLLDYRVVNEDEVRLFNQERLAELARKLLPLTDVELVREKLRAIIEKDDALQEKRKAEKEERDRRDLENQNTKSKDELKREENERLELFRQGAIDSIMILSDEKKRWLYDQVTNSNHNTILGKIEEGDVLDDHEKDPWRSLLKGGIDSIVVFGQMKLTLEEELGI